MAGEKSTKEGEQWACFHDERPFGSACNERAGEKLRQKFRPRIAYSSGTADRPAIFQREYIPPRV
jgi:hypothetical protein